MTETAIELRHAASAVVMTNQQLNFISRTEFVPGAMRGNLPAIMACVATGRAIGIPDMTALRSIHIIDGKATFSAELMVNLVRAHGHSITFKASGESCTAYGRRVDNDDEGEFTWTLEMAERAGLMNKQNWKRYPEAMLWARAVSQLCRMLFADCFAGASYTPEELGAGADVSADELMDETIVVEADPADVLVAELLDLAGVLNVQPEASAQIDAHRGSADFVDWLGNQIDTARRKIAEREQQANGE